jgi:geranylgeranyl diphosphate/geranylgeranyl-bacteriochlorophyllide a reductase
MNTTDDIVIVGGGPAGAYCALELSKKGFYPTIFDHSHPREKPCGGGISPLVIKKFPFLEKFRSTGCTFGNFKIISCTDFQVFTKELENGYCISRRYFDQGILDMATENGSKLIKEKVIMIQKKGRIWKIKTNKRVFSSQMIVGADGVNSCVRTKIVGPIAVENLGLTFGYLTKSLEKITPVIKFLAEMPGYIWVFPGHDYTNIGIGSELKYGNILKKRVDSFIRSNYPKIKLVSKYAAMIPSATDPKFFKFPCAGKNWILIGDAAGHVDPIGGGGILYALWGGKLAADAIKNSDPKSFDFMWRKEYGKNLEKRCKNKDAYYDPVESTIAFMRGLAKKTYFIDNRNRGHLKKSEDLTLPK